MAPKPEVAPKAQNAHPANNGGRKRPAGEALPAQASKKSKADKPEKSNAPKPYYQKMRDLRAIPAQYTDAALKEGELDVQAFVNARGFEMAALDESMRRSQSSSKNIAFQQVPFQLRRRAAAHNHHRVPKRLQAKAKAGMMEDKRRQIEGLGLSADMGKKDALRLVGSKNRKLPSTRARLRAETARRLDKLKVKKRRAKMLSKGLDEDTITTRIARPKIKRNALNSPTITAPRFKKRQISKTWLPTHLWHAKRARMTEPLKPLWTFAIPVTPTQKCARPTHRANWQKGAMAWDTSYMSTIGLCGTPASIQHVLKAVGLTQESLWAGSGAKWRAGTVHVSANLSRKRDGNVRDIGPATIIWNPAPESDKAGSAEGSKPSQRRLFLRVHPSIFNETFEELLRMAKGQNPRPYVEDLRYEIGSIEVAGPEATEALLGVLKPYYSKPESTEVHASKFESLAAVRDPLALPTGTLLAFSVADPRLRYPPRPVKMPDLSNPNAQTAWRDTLASWRQDRAAKQPHGLFDRDARFKASQLPKQASINRRRGEGPPGVFLEPSAADPPIPILLLATHQAHSTGPAGAAGKQSGIWVVMMPWKCVLPVWQCLMHCPLSTKGNPAFGGLDEKRQLAFEHGAPWFPGDFPGTDAGAAWELDQRRARKAAWDRMPKGKRSNYESLDLGAGRKGEIGEGWSCDFEAVLGLRAGGDPDDGKEPPAPQEDLVDSGEKRQEAEATPLVVKQQPLAQLVHLSKSAFNAHLSSPGSAGPLPPAAIVTVRITVLSRGVPTPCARLYRLPLPRPRVASTQAQVPATDPPPRGEEGKGKGKLPADLTAQWLAQSKETTTTTTTTRPHDAARPPPRHNSAARGLDVEMRRRLLAQELVGPGPGPRRLLPYPPAAPNQDGVNGHPLCPDADDLIGFVTSGGFNLRHGRPEAVGSVSAARVLEELEAYGNNRSKGRGEGEGKGVGMVCVFRNAGQNVGWLARWELI